MDCIDQRLAAVRCKMAELGYDALVIPRADEYLGEYVPRHNERLQWVSGFTGSAGMVVVMADSAAIFVDGRYTVQVRKQVSASHYSYNNLIEDPLVPFLAGQLATGATVAVDSRLHTLNWYQQHEAGLAAVGLTLQASPCNLVDECWQDRPLPQVDPALLLPEEFSGEASSVKRRRIGQHVADAGADAALIFAPDSVSWLLNIRGTDIPMLPVVQSMAVLRSDGSVILLVDPGRVPEGLAQHVGEGLAIAPESAAQEVFSGFAGMSVLVDPNTANAWTQLALQRCGATLVAGDDPVLIPRACKNTVEQQGARRAHVRDAVAEIKFLCWLDSEVEAGRLHDEAILADRLYQFREQGEHFRGGSFDTISAAGPNAAMCHYNHKDTVPARLQMNTVYLVDSGAQYTDGTTDITRTVAIGDPGAEVRRLFTLVLKGHIALDEMRFPQGTTGSQLDAVARQYLWREGFDYDHGTGHGVGSFLSVHEAPQRISRVHNPVALRPGMILSNEPGYYRDNAFGIRCENLVIVQSCDSPEQEVPMLEFEAITLVPFDRRLLDLALLDSHELAWLNRYHARVRDTMAGLLPQAEQRWLEQATNALPAHD
jgi:Xaa-Pro aminopeptidase